MIAPGCRGRGAGGKAAAETTPVRSFLSEPGHRVQLSKDRCLPLAGAGRGPGSCGKKGIPWHLKSGCEICICYVIGFLKIFPERHV